MLILLPVLLLLFTALTLAAVRFLWPNFRYPWMIAALGGVLSIVGVFLWKIHFPASFSLPAWQPAAVSPAPLIWVADDTSWPYALALTALAAAVIWTSVARNENEPLSWASTLLLSAVGVLAVSAGNLLTLVLVWSALDLAELAAMLRSTSGKEQAAGVVGAFAARVAGTGFLLWAGLVSASVTAATAMNLHAIPPQSGVYIPLAVGLRLGVLPLHLPYRRENVLRRGFGTTLRLVSAAASLVLMARVPASALNSPLVPYIFVLTILAALYAAWMWLRASDEILGRPFWVLGLAALVIAAGLRGDPRGSVGLGAALVLCGGLLFLFSARQRNLLWLPLLGVWGAASLPFSLTASAWQTINQSSLIFVLPFLPVQGMLLAGFVRHAIHPGETSLESQERWVKGIYPAGLLFLAAALLLLGVWGWSGAGIIGAWWAGMVVLLLAIGFSALGMTVLTRLPPVSDRWSRMFRLEGFYRLLLVLYDLLRRAADLITSSLEEEGGLLWSFVLLALVLSILSGGQ